MIQICPSALIMYANVSNYVEGVIYLIKSHKVYRLYRFSLGIPFRITNYHEISLWSIAITEHILELLGMFPRGGKIAIKFSLYLMADINSLIYVI